LNQELYNLDKETLVGLIFDSLHLTAVHYGLWFAETEQQLGIARAAELDDMVWEKLLPIMLRRLARRFGISMEDDLPGFLNEASKEELLEVLKDLAKNWSASDGVWFQALESSFSDDMFRARKVNNPCFARFSYIEAKVIMKRFSLPERGGLPALRRALSYRQKALINKHEIFESSENKLIFRINECRVQQARKRAGLPEYPCKAADTLGFTSFVNAVDPRIKVTCIGCPPDPHPDEWYCAWQFTIQDVH
jgi:hypothetical protein